VDHIEKNREVWRTEIKKPTTLLRFVAHWSLNAQAFDLSTCAGKLKKMTQVLAVGNSLGKGRVKYHQIFWAVRLGPKNRWVRKGEEKEKEKEGLVFASQTKGEEDKEKKHPLR